MQDSSKVKIERIDELITELANLSTSISELNQSFTDFKALTNATLKNFQETVNEEFSEMQTSLNTQITTLQSNLEQEIETVDDKFSDKNYTIQYPNIKESGRITVSPDTNYTLTSNCWVWWGNTSYVGSRYFYINDIEIGHSYGNSGRWEEFNALLIPLAKGNVIKHTGTNSLCYIYPS